ncbi:MAG: glycosyltransferase [Clostridiales bacterium]|nr:glycosyltransferase [Clostridiales bacterium]OPZ69000.1 MAG: Glycosyl transferase family 2 [Firmicutes bacterium ADurb.Bin467]
MTAVIVPAYKPSEELLQLAEQFRGYRDFQLIIVDDGSGPEYRAVFDALPAPAIVLRHEANRGKGAAIKTAMRYALDNLPNCGIALTADADGQHAFLDIIRVNEVARANPDALTLGCRAFRGDVPLRSRLGNALTRQVFAIVGGRYVSDTQTGLRAFGRETMRRFLEIPGERYEYEINMLLAAAREGMPIREVEIETIYLRNNESSHFHPVRDSIRIYARILLFACSSLLSFGVDMAAVLLFNALLLRHFPAEEALLGSVVAARLLSAAVNFTINRQVVFRGNERLQSAAVKYALLAACILAVNYAMLRLLTLRLGWPLGVSKLLVEATLFALSFVAQGRFVYRRAVK